MNDKFVDTSYLIALINRQDMHHAKASELAVKNTASLVTTQWVLLELFDAYCRRETRRGVIRFIARLEAQENLDIINADSEWFERGSHLYKSRDDKNWSLTDCISFSVMKSMGLRDALTADHHFEQAGFKALLLQG